MRSSRVGGAGEELNSRVQSEVGLEFYRLRRSLGSHSSGGGRQTLDKPAAGSYFATATVLRSQPRGGLQPDQATKPCLEGRRGFLGREERRLASRNRAQSWVAGHLATRNSNEVASYFGGVFLRGVNTILGLLSSAFLLCRNHSAPCVLWGRTHIITSGAPFLFPLRGQPDWRAASTRLRRLPA